MDWSASQYLQFEGERTRPALDLLNAVPTPQPRRIVDLGCGPANSTELLARRYPAARVAGLDTSPDMIRAARERLPGVEFALADITSWQPDTPWDLIFANAVLQWLPGHATLLPRLASALSAGGSLAIQMPDNLDEPSHALMRVVAAEGPWAPKLASAAAARARLGSAAEHYALLEPICRRVDIWRTTYHHPLEGSASIIEWLRGSGLRPFLAPLDEVERAGFLERYRERLKHAYPALPDGKVLLAFPRLFVVATRA